ncbi:hypothetical protein B4U80_12991 [Leptotrombidium deliense]|uniref:Chromo shadow domain-containing protein n=1 Tax=Leptotrombidium deliense TaxID=299467 RepID=A0A443SFJ6_9ACAR|nr:hypothetical protein B4U80_12991 [Leptotrombidium deliense]
MKHKVTINVNDPFSVCANANEVESLLSDPEKFLSNEFIHHLIGDDPEDADYSIPEPILVKFENPEPTYVRSVPNFDAPILKERQTLRTENQIERRYSVRNKLRTLKKENKRRVSEDRTFKKKSKALINKIYCGYFENFVKDMHRKDSKNKETLVTKEYRSPRDVDFVNIERTGLEVGFIPEKVVGIEEIDGEIVFNVKIVGPGSRYKVIPSRILSKIYPQIVIKFYESMLYMVDVNTQEDEKLIVH